MKVFVTGGSGFLGRCSISHIISSGHDVIALARSETATKVLQGLGAQTISGDLNDASSVRHAFVEGGADVLLNIASLGFGHAPTIVQAAEDAGFGHCVFVSTTAVETQLNAASKTIRLSAEESITASSVSWTIIRPTMIYGAPGDRNVERLLGALKYLPILPLPGGGGRLQQPVHVADAAHALLGACAAGVSVGQIYNVAGPVPITFRSLVEHAKRAVSSNTQIVQVPLAAVIAITRLYEKVVSNPRIKVEQLERLMEDKVFSIDAARSDLGFDPRPFDAGVRQEVLALWPS